MATSSTDSEIDSKGLDPAGGVPKVRGEIVSILANGTPVDSRHRFLPGTVPTNAMTSDRARELAHKRWDKAAKASRQQLVEAVRASGVDAKSPAEAWGVAVGEVAKGALANAMNSPHDAARALKFVGQSTEMLRPQERTSNLPTVAVQVNIGGDLAAGWRAAGAPIEVEE